MNYPNSVGGRSVRNAPETLSLSYKFRSPPSDWLCHAAPQRRIACVALPVVRRNRRPRTEEYFTTMTDPMVQESKGAAKEAAVPEQAVSVAVVQEPTDAAQEAVVTDQQVSSSQTNPDVRGMWFE